MHFKTVGIIIRSIKYADSSLIVKVYTEQMGLISFLARGVHKKKATVKSYLFNPLALVEITGSKNNKSNLHNIKEVNALNAFSSVYNNVFKSAIVLFINEVLQHSIKEEEPNVALFSFIKESIEQLEKKTENYQNHHLIFMTHLLRHLGCFPLNNFSTKNSVFNLSEGLFEPSEKPGIPYLNHPLGEQFAAMLSLDFYNPNDAFITNSIRKNLLRALLTYYQLHVSNFKDIKSHLVLESVLS